jgi:hypothetical protein
VTRSYSDTLDELRALWRRFLEQLLLGFGIRGEALSQPATGKHYGIAVVFLLAFVGLLLQDLQS